LKCDEEILGRYIFRIKREHLAFSERDEKTVESIRDKLLAEGITTNFYARLPNSHHSVPDVIQEEVDQANRGDFNKDRLEKRLTQSAYLIKLF